MLYNTSGDIFCCCKYIACAFKLPMVIKTCTFNQNKYYIIYYTYTVKNNIIFNTYLQKDYLSCFFGIQDEAKNRKKILYFSNLIFWIVKMS